VANQYKRVIVIVYGSHELILELISITPIFVRARFIPSVPAAAA
jgi:hypothetical protein